MASQDYQYIKQQNSGIAIKDVNLLRGELMLSKASSVRIGRPGRVPRYILNETAEALVRSYVDKTDINTSEYLIGRLFLNIIESSDCNSGICFRLCPALYMFFSPCEIKIGEDVISVDSGDIIVVTKDKIKLEKCEHYPIELICFPMTHKRQIRSRVECPPHVERSINPDKASSSTEATTSETSSTDKDNVPLHRQLINGVLLSLLSSNSGEMYDLIVEAIKIEDDVVMLSELLNIIKHYIDGTVEYYSIRNSIYTLAKQLKIDIADRKIADTFDLIHSIKKDPFIQMIDNINEEFVRQAKEDPYIQEFRYRVPKWCTNTSVEGDIIAKYNNFGTMRREKGDLLFKFESSNVPDVKGKSKE